MTKRLKILLIILAAAVGLLVGRIEYLHGYAAYHQQEANRFVKLIGMHRNASPLEVDSALELAAANPDDDRLDYKFQVVFHHRTEASACQKAVYRPWMIVQTHPMPKRQYDE